MQAQAIPVILSGRHAYPFFNFRCLLLRFFFFLYIYIEKPCVGSLMRNFSLVNAATGTGKTAAYLAPIVHHLQGYENRIQRSDGTFGAFCFSFVRSDGTSG